MSVVISTSRLLISGSHTYTPPTRANICLDTSSKVPTTPSPKRPQTALVASVSPAARQLRAANRDIIKMLINPWPLLHRFQNQMLLQTQTGNIKLLFCDVQQITGARLTQRGRNRPVKVLINIPGGDKTRLPAKGVKSEQSRCGRQVGQPRATERTSVSGTPATVC